MEFIDDAYGSLGLEAQRLQQELVNHVDGDDAQRAALVTAMRTAEWAQEMLEPLVHLDAEALVGNPKAEAARVNLARLADLEGEGFIRSGNALLSDALEPTQLICADTARALTQQLAPDDIGL